ncbi:PTS system beta-glucoside-specific EIIBCA component [Collinsella aerofaciens]|uniref:PTS system beta-glucoside-specific EIIBCA component n=1 Tax=Collinsella aerofaciens TaxID=74426 RepID=A0A5K1J737_9ACTN|nr:PTS transporter subunit EIIC [Collinsella aerofaciens]VWL96548.1 PTS system beta-glucoside-specific EIIBCA component [Collinsella aerofaciens]VWL99014.1 PTS system beta-glucoside-specific EIIBCA component [Collinsella aerofaciens]
MAKKDYPAIASSVVELVGGKDNIASVKHCITRLRFVLKNQDEAKTDEIKAVPGVVDVVLGNGQYQVVIGPDVDDAYEEVIKILGAGFDGGAVAAEPTDEGKRGSIVDRAADLVSSIFMPCLGGMAGVGLLRALLVVLTNTGLMSADCGAYTVLYAASDAFMYFLPLALSITAADRFKMNRFTAFAVVGALVYPTITKAYQDGAALDFFGLPVNLMSYGQSVLPALLTVFVASKLEHAISKVMPKSLRFMLVPTICVGIMVPIELLALGPVSMLIGNVFADAFMVVYNFAPQVAAFIYGCFYPCLIIFGAHWALIPIAMNNYAVLGYDWLMPLGFGCTYAIAGATLGVMLKTKFKPLKEMASANTIVAVFAGVTEPAIYGVLLKYKRPFVCACLSAGVGGVIVSIAGFQRLAQVGLNLFTIPALAMFPGGWSVPVCVVLSFVLATILTYLFGFSDNMLSDADKKARQAELDAE